MGRQIGERRTFVWLDNEFMVDFRDLLQKTLQSDDPMPALEALVERHPDLPAAVGKFWADGFGTEKIPPAVARFLVERGATLSVHPPQDLVLLTVWPACSAAIRSWCTPKGGDGCTPLHFACDVTTAQLLLDHGADIDYRDDDHDSTPAQWRIGAAPEVSRFLLERGADIFLAAALGDVELAARLVSQNPSCVLHCSKETRGFSIFFTTRLTRKRVCWCAAF